MERTFLSAVSVGRLLLDLPKHILNCEYSRQIIKSSSSVGANYRAARRAKSAADFLNKLKIVEEEIDESIYFLALLKEFNPDFGKRTGLLLKEATEILKIIISSITTTRRRTNKQ